MRYSVMPDPSKQNAMILRPGDLRLADLRRIARAPVALTLADADRSAIAASAAIVARIVRDGAVRLAMALKINCLAQARSGVRPVVVDALLRLLEQGIYPVIPSKGSVGASGDLAPLAHLAGVLIGIGEVRRDGQVMPASEGLAAAGLAPLRLAPKEG